MKKTIKWGRIIGTLIIVIILIAIFLIAANKKSEEKIKIGVALPLTGAWAVGGEAVKEGIRKGLLETKDYLGATGITSFDKLE